MIEPGQVYERAGVVVLVVRKRSSLPDEWGNLGSKAWRNSKATWYDVLNLSSDTEIDFHREGRVVAWREDLFDPRRCKRIV